MNRDRGHHYGGSHRQQQQQPPQHHHHHQQQQQQQNYHSNYAYHNPHGFAQHHNSHPDDHHPHNHHNHSGHSLSYTPTSRSSDLSSRSSKYRRQPRGCGYKCLRGFFSSCNFVFWLMGCAVLGAGIWLHFSKSEYHAVLPISSNDYLCSATLAIAVGATVLVIGFLGCCGSLMQVRCMLLAYFIILMLLVLIECGIGLMGFAYKDEIDTSVKQELQKTIAIAKRGHEADEETEEDQRIRTAWDSLQRDWRCCGVDGYHDWTGTSTSSFGEKVIMAYSAHHRSRDHSNGRVGKKHHHHHHRSSNAKQRKEDILFIPDSCCRVEEDTRRGKQHHSQSSSGKTGGGGGGGGGGGSGEKRKKKKEASSTTNGSSGEKGLSCSSGVPVSHVKKLLADLSSSFTYSSSPSSPASSLSSLPPVHLDGCYSGLKAWFVRHQAAFSYSVLGLAVLQFLGLLAAMMLFCVLGEYGRFW